MEILCPELEGYATSRKKEGYATSKMDDMLYPEMGGYATTTKNVNNINDQHCVDRNITNKTCINQKLTLRTHISNLHTEGNIIP